MVVKQGELAEDLTRLVLLEQVGIAALFALEAPFLNDVEDVAAVSLSHHHFALLHAPRADLGDELEYALMREMLEEDALLEVHYQVHLRLL